MIPGIVASQAGVLEAGGGASAPGVTWNPDDKHAAIDLSDQDLVATTTGTNAYRAVRATVAYDTGLRYFECRPLAVANDVEMAPLGLATASASLANYAGSGSGANFSAGYFADGAVYANNSFVQATGKPIAEGAWAGLLVDFDAGKAWVRDADGWDGDPLDGADSSFTFTPGTMLLPMASLYGLGDQVEFNGGHAAFAYDLDFPDGATAWDGDAIVPGSEGGGALDNLSENPTFAFSLSRILIDAYGGALYVESGGVISQINDQSGHGRNLSQATALARPALSTAGPNAIACADFDGVNHVMPMTGVSIGNVIAATSFYIAISAIINSPASNDATMSQNGCLWMDSGGDLGFFLKSAPTGHAMIDDGGTERSTTHGGFPQGEVVVIEVKRDGGTFSSRINGGTWQVIGATISANNPSATTFRVAGNTLSAVFTDCQIFEGVAFNDLLESAEEDSLVADMMDHAGAEQTG